MLGLESHDVRAHRVLRLVELPSAVVDDTDKCAHDLRKVRARVGAKPRVRAVAMAMARVRVRVRGLGLSSSYL